MDSLEKMKMDEEKFLALLGNLIGRSEKLQNNPPEGVYPTEDLAVEHVLDVLEPYSVEKGGPLKINHKSYKEGRGNLILEYPGTVGKKICSFVGSHFDVVTANKDSWTFDPFKLTKEGDRLQGRGTTDCLGHVALVTELFRQLAESKVKLKSTVVAVFIANEENSSELGIGIDKLVDDGLLDNLKNGPLFWVDVADKQPCIGTGGMLVWKLKAEGKLFHSGLPHKAINPLEMIMEALRVIQDRFYADFPPTKEEETYGFATPTTMKPTQWSVPVGGLNQIPGECTISGDCRITPFYSIDDVENKIRHYVDDINANIETLGTRGPVSKYVLHEETTDENGNIIIKEIKGKLFIEFDPIKTPGLACDLDSRGYKALCDATLKVIGELKPYSITGTLPLIKELQDNGFDVQTIGYGNMDTYHANDEYCYLSDMKQGFQVLANVIAILED